MSTLEEQNRALEAEVARLRQQITELQRSQPDQTTTLPYQAIFDQFPIPVVIFRRDGTAADINRQNQQLIHAEHEAIVDKHNILNDPEAQAQGYVAHFTQALKGEVAAMPPTAYNTAVANLEGRSQDRQLWTETTYFPIRDPNGEVAYVGEVNLDVTARMEFETAHRQSDAYTRAMLSLIPDMLFRLNRDGVYLDAHGRIENVPVAEFLGKSVREVLPQIAPVALSGIRKALDTKEIQSLTYDLDTPIGTRNYEARIVAINNDEVLVVVRDTSEQLAAEQERIAFQEQIIAAQQAALRELSTPLIPVAEGVVVMPLVGAIDSARSGQVMETLLEGIVATQSEHAILDITGVRVVDTQVASALLRVAQAAQLLGAKVILTGIGAEVAQALIHLGADLGNIVTRSNLQSGIAYALNGE